jgi:hypothetical protein
MAGHGNNGDADLPFQKNSHDDEGRGPSVVENETHPSRKIIPNSDKTAIVQMHATTAFRTSEAIEVGLLVGIGAPSNRATSALFSSG